MKINEIRKQLTSMKIHIDQIDVWVKQASDMIYEIEESLFDLEDKQDCQKYEEEVSIDFFKVAASGIYLLKSPPRLNSSRCSKDHIAADGFYQPDFKINKIV